MGGSWGEWERDREVSFERRVWISGREGGGRKKGGRGSGRGGGGWRCASFKRESPGWMRILAAPGLFAAGATGAARGTSDGVAGIGLEGSSKFGAAVGGAVRDLGE